MSLPCSRLAKAIGVSRASLYKWMAGQFEPSLDKLAALSAVANVDLDWLITGRGEPRPRDLPGYIKPGFYPGDPPVAFASDWVESKLGPRRTDVSEELRSHIAPRQMHETPLLTLLEVPDDAMEPTFRKGDLLLSQHFGWQRRLPGIYLVARTHAKKGELVLHLDLKTSHIPTRGEDVSGKLLIDAEGNLVQRLLPRRVEWSADDEAIVKCDNPAYPHQIIIRNAPKRPLILHSRVVWHGRLI